MNELRNALAPVYHGLAMGVLALIFGGLWAAYIATHHETLHGSFEAAENKIKQAEMKGIQADMSMSAMNMPSMGHEHAVGATHAHTDTSAHEEGAQHSHSGSLATDSMQRLLRGHIHFMGIGLLTMVMLILVASTSLRKCWKQVLACTFGFGALMYPPAWIIMGFRTVELGPQGAEASILWLFGPAVGLLLGSLIAVFVILILEFLSIQTKIPLVKFFFEKE